jgi:putative ABC transport system substrate-binding protein
MIGCHSYGSRMTTRRDVLAVIGVGALAVARISRAQQSAGKVHRIAFLGTGAASAMEAPIEAFKAALRDLGYVEGKNIHIEYHWGEDKPERLSGLAQDLVARKMEIIVVWGTGAAFAVKRLTSDISIVLVNVGDPDQSGLVISLARPGGNITGVANLGGPVVAKQLELLTQSIPGMTRIGVLRNPANRSLAAQLKGAEMAAAPLRLQLEVVDVRAPADLEAAFNRMAAAHVSGVLVLAEPLFVSERGRIAELAIKHRLPAVSARSEIADSGLLMTYGASATEQFRTGAAYTAKILRGARPAELPIEQAAKFELVINLKTAAALGLRIPEAILLRADRVIR